jgi:hypothetical protein
VIHGDTRPTDTKYAKIHSALPLYKRDVRDQECEKHTADARLERIRIAFRVSRKEYEQLGAHELWPQLRTFVTHRFSPEEKRSSIPSADLTWQT